MTELPYDFPHQPPEGYSYEIEKAKGRNIYAIWLRHHRDYVYSDDAVRTIWGFYNVKKSEYFSPISSTKVGARVDPNDTRSYTAMPLLQTVHPDATLNGLTAILYS